MTKMIFKKKKNLFIGNVLLVIFAIFLCHCAQVTAPSGGPKDVTPPRALHFSPENEKANFSAKIISITFDEFFVLENASEQFLISPLLKPKPTFKIKGKTLLVDLRACTLQENTTYSIFFGESIKDLNEHNVLTDFYYVFSTGDYVDSLCTNGIVKNAFDMKPQEKTFVMLYSCSNDTIPCDSLPYLVQPDYITQTKSDGAFILKNLAEKPYRVFALKDQNRNFMYDMGEEIAFLDSLLVPKILDFQNHHDTTASLMDSGLALADSLSKIDSIKTGHAGFVKLFMFKEQDSAIKILRTHILDSTHIALGFSRPVSNVTFSVSEPVLENSPDSIPWNIAKWSKEADSVTIWFPYFISDSICLIVNHEEISIDTLEFSLKKQKVQATRSRKKDSEIEMVMDTLPKYLSIGHNGSGKMPFFSDLELKFDVPIYSWNAEGILFYIENDSITLKIPPIITDGVFFQKAKFDYHFKEKTSYQVMVPRGAFVNILGYQNDSTVISFTTDEANIYGAFSLIFNIPEQSPQILLQLLTEKEQLVQQHVVNESKTVNFGYLKPGKFILKIICDTNRNERWDAGNYLHKIEPERVYYYNKIIEMRANWDVEEEWDVEFGEND